MKSLITTFYLALCMVGATTLAVAEDRLGVREQDEMQRKLAMEAAPNGNDQPLAVGSDLGVSKQLSLAAPVGPSTIEQNVAEALEPVTLDEVIQQQTVQHTLDQFGYDIFSVLTTTFAPVDSIPVPLDYIVGPGDTFVVQLFSAADVQYTLVVSREGKLLVPEVGALQVAGLTFGEAKTLITESVNSIRIGVKTLVTLAELHTIQIMIVGEVSQPGAYTVSGLSSLLNALISSGGVKRSGSLRNIQVKRGGQIVADFDLYELLLKGIDTGNIYLRHGDIVFVPPVRETISIAGEVQRPAIYELKHEKTVDEAIELSGGLLATAAKSKSQIERITEQGSYTLIQVDLASEGKSTSLKNGDLIRVLPVLDKMDEVVVLSGHVLTPGAYQWRSDMRVSDLVVSREHLRLGAEFNVGFVERENRDTKRSEVRFFSLGEALGSPGNSNDIELSPRDRVHIFDTHSARAAQLADTVRKLKNQETGTDRAPVVALKGYFKHGGEYPFQPGDRLLDLINYSGGFRSATDLNYTILARTDFRTGRVELTHLELTKALENRIGDHNPLLEPYDRIYLFDSKSNRSELLKNEIAQLRRQTPYGQLAPVVEAKGDVNLEGVYPLTPGMRVEDLIVASGGLKEEAYGSAATLSRQALLEGEYSRTDLRDLSLMKSNSNLDDRSTILQPYDQLIVRRKPEWIDTPKYVTVEGEVIHPGRYRVDKRETLCGLMTRIGGFTEDAYLFGTAFFRESVRQREQRALDRLMEQMDDLLAEVHMSPGFNKAEKLPSNQGTNDTFQVIKQLKPAKALGRLVIDMESAVVDCSETADLVLEDGDRIVVPKYLDEVSVAGQVYFPTSHKFQSDRAALDYINLSGGTKELAQREHAYVVQANGEVMTVRSRASTWGWLGSPSNVNVTPGSTIVVPLSVDRINGREFTQSWLDMFYKLTVSVASIDFLFTQ